MNLPLNLTWKVWGFTPGCPVAEKHLVSHAPNFTVQILLYCQVKVERRRTECSACGEMSVQECDGLFVMQNSISSSIFPKFSAMEFSSGSPFIFLSVICLVYYNVSDLKLKPEWESLVVPDTFSYIWLLSSWQALIHFVQTNFKTKLDQKCYMRFYVLQRV